MQKVKWWLISMMTLALIFSSSLAFAGGRGQSQGQGNNCPYGASVSRQAGQGQRNNNQAGRGYHKGWQRHGAGQASGPNNRSNAKGNANRGSQKQG